MRALRPLGIALALLLLGVASNQTISRGYIYSNIGSLFTWSGSAPSGWSASKQIATIADFDTYVKNNGSCGTPPVQSYRDITYGEATACAVNSSSISEPTDPWFIHGGLDWNTISGSANFAGTTDPLGSPPTGAQDAYGATSSFTVEQALDGGAQIIGGTPMTASFDADPTSMTISYYNSSSCTTTSTATASGSATIEILNSSGSPVSGKTATTNGWSHYTASGSAPSNGVYYVAVVVTVQTKNYSYYLQNPKGCLGPYSSQVIGSARATNIGASN